MFTAILLHSCVAQTDTVTRRRVVMWWPVLLPSPVFREYQVRFSSQRYDILTDALHGFAQHTQSHAGTVL
jgi:hypothetical protein